MLVYRKKRVLLVNTTEIPGLKWVSIRRTFTLETKRPPELVCNVPVLTKPRVVEHSPLVHNLWVGTMMRHTCAPETISDTPWRFA